MASRSKYVFVTSSEFAEWLRDAAEHLGLLVVLYRGPNGPLEHWDGHPETLAGSRRVYIAAHSINLAGVSSDNLKPGQLGWVQLDVPRSDGPCLLAAQIAARSDWFDAKEQKSMESSAALLLFDRFWSHWKRRFTFPVWARNRTTGAEAPYQSIGYSRGAAEWCRCGGELRQEGVGNIDFKIPEDAR
jgi:hypothetical protein